MLAARYISRKASRARLFHASAYFQAKSLRPFLLADIGEGITECEVLKWNVRPPNTIGAFDPLCEVQSDKASVEITSPFDGVVKELLVQEGEIAKVGQQLCIIEVEDEVEVEVPDIPSVGDSVEQAGDATPVVAAEVSRPAETDRPLSVGVNSEPSVRERRPHPLDPAHPPQTSNSSTPSSLPLTSPNTRFAPAPNTLAAPSVRHFARTKNIEDLSVIHPGSGKNGRIEKKDVEAYLIRDQSKSSAAPSIAAQESAPEEIELGRTRWAMYKAMTKSLEIPHFGYSTTLDLTALSNLLAVADKHIPASFNPPPPPKYLPPVSPYSIYSKPPPVVETDPATHYTRMTTLPFLLKTLSRAMAKWPIFRSSITPSGPDPSAKPTLTVRPHADISLALSTPTGLYSPTIQAVDTMSTYEIMGEVRRLSHLGRQVPSGLTTKEMPRRGGTLTVSNVGAIGKGEWAAPLLVPGGGVAIVAIGRAKWVETIERGRRLEVGVSWSADHRVVEGAEMAAFVEEWRAWVEHPERMVADGK